MSTLKLIQIDPESNKALNSEAKRLGKRKSDLLASIVKSFFALKPSHRAMEHRHLPPKLTGRPL